MIAQSRGSNTIAGNYTSSAVSTNVALNGAGFFVVRDRASTQSGLPVFSQRDLYTRRGDFTLDKNGYLVKARAATWSAPISTQDGRADRQPRRAPVQWRLCSRRGLQRKI